MLLLIYALVRAPEQGWGSARTIGELATAGVVLAAFTVIELRRRHPLFPFSIFRVKGLAAADITQMIAFAAFVSVFYFLTLYMQNVIGFSPVRSGSAYLPVTAGIIVAAGISSRLFARTGTRPVIVADALIAAAGVWYLSRIPVHGTDPASLLPGLVIMAIGIGAVLVSVTTAANAGVAEDKAGLAAGLLERLPAAGYRPRAGDLLRHRHRPHSACSRARPPAAALTAGFHSALLACAVFLLAAAVIGMRTTNSRGEPAARHVAAPAAREQVPAASRPTDPPAPLKQESQQP